MGCVGSKESALVQDGEKPPPPKANKGAKGGKEEGSSAASAKLTESRSSKGGSTRKPAAGGKGESKGASKRQQSVSQQNKNSDKRPESGPAKESPVRNGVTVPAGSASATVAPSPLSEQAPDGSRGASAPMDPPSDNPLSNLPLTEHTGDKLAPQSPLRSPPRSDDPPSDIQNPPAAQFPSERASLRHASPAEGSTGREKKNLESPCHDAGPADPGPGQEIAQALERARFGASRDPELQDRGNPEPNSGHSNPPDPGSFRHLPPAQSEPAFHAQSGPIQGGASSLSAEGFAPITLLSGPIGNAAQQQQQQRILTRSITSVPALPKATSLATALPAGAGPLPTPPEAQGVVTNNAPPPERHLSLPRSAMPTSPLPFPGAPLNTVLAPPEARAQATEGSQPLRLAPMPFPLPPAFPASRLSLGSVASGLPVSRIAVSGPLQRSLSSDYSHPHMAAAVAAAAADAGTTAEYCANAGFPAEFGFVTRSFGSRGAALLSGKSASAITGANAAVFERLLPTSNSRSFGRHKRSSSSTLSNLNSLSLSPLLADGEVGVKIGTRTPPPRIEGATGASRFNTSASGPSGEKAILLGETPHARAHTIATSMVDVAAATVAAVDNQALSGTGSARESPPAWLVVVDPREGSNNPDMGAQQQQQSALPRYPSTRSLVEQRSLGAGSIAGPSHSKALEHPNGQNQLQALSQTQSLSHTQSQPHGDQGLRRAVSAKQPSPTKSALNESPTPRSKDAMPPVASPEPGSTPGITQMQPMGTPRQMVPTPGLGPSTPSPLPSSLPSSSPSPSTSFQSPSPATPSVQSPAQMPSHAPVVHSRQSSQDSNMSKPKSFSLRGADGPPTPQAGGLKGVPRALSQRNAPSHQRTPSGGSGIPQSPASGGGGGAMSRLSQPLSIMKPTPRSAAQILGLSGSSSAANTPLGFAGPSPRFQPSASPLPKPPPSPPRSPPNPPVSVGTSGGSGLKQRLLGGLAAPLQSLAAGLPSTPSSGSSAQPLPLPLPAVGQDSSGHSGAGVHTLAPSGSSSMQTPTAAHLSGAHSSTIRSSASQERQLLQQQYQHAHTHAHDQSGISNSSISGLSGLIPSQLRMFSYSELKSATRNFAKDNLLGEGGFGGVFRGLVDPVPGVPAPKGEKMLVAVKKLNKNGMQGQKEWLAEVNTLGCMRHPQLVQLLGYCAQEDHRLLVYEFMPNRSLEDHLFGQREGVHNAPPALGWIPRMRVLLDAAKGLAYLHEELDLQVIFRDFKAANVLLDNNLNAKLSDFGLARAGPEGDHTHVSTQVVGTVGYAAPEYVLTGHLTSRSDVWSFGVVLVEALTGRRALDDRRPREEANLIDWARPFLAESRRLFRIMDPALDGKYSSKAAQRVAAVALQCLHKNPKHRMSMSQVVEAFLPLQDMTDMACVSPLAPPSPAGGYAMSPVPSPSAAKYRLQGEDPATGRSLLGLPSSGSGKNNLGLPKPPQLPVGKQQYTSPLVAQLRERQQQQQLAQGLGQGQQLMQQGYSAQGTPTHMSQPVGRSVLDLIGGGNSAAGPGSRGGQVNGGGHPGGGANGLGVVPAAAGSVDGGEAGMGQRGTLRERANAGRAVPLAIQINKSQQLGAAAAAAASGVGPGPQTMPNSFRSPMVGFPQSQPSTPYCPV